MRPALAAALGLALLAAPGRAQERPSEEELFGAPAPAEPPPEAREAPVEAPVAPSPSTTPRDGEATLRTGSGPEVRSRGAAPVSTDERAADLLGGSRRDAPTGRWDKEKEDPLKVGGLLYSRAASSWSRGVPASAWPLSAPSLLDTYLDVRPNDRVRGFVLGRLTYDPTLVTTGVDLAGRPVTRSQTRAVLDQLYVNFDVERTVFVTAGKQHVKWGTGRFWNPGDFLHPVRRDPLAQFDDRSGVTMVRAHLPWEARGWNLYGVAVLEDLAGRFNTMTAQLRESYADLEKKVEVRTAELSDALSQQTATADVLRVISSSTTDVMPVFEVSDGCGCEKPRAR